MEMDTMTLREIENNAGNYYFRAINLQHVPVAALRPQTRKQLSLMLNPQKIFLSDDGDFRDWRGLLTRVGLDNSHRTFIEQDIDPTAKILNVFELKPIEFANLERLQEILGFLDRWDVVDDTNNYFMEDARVYLTAKMNNENQDIVNSNQQASAIYNLNSQFDIIVSQDIDSARLGMPKVIFDAFVLYADQDIEFAHELVERMEDVGLKLCMKDRDFLAGIQFKQAAIMHLISERCHCLIIIVSPEFFNSPENQFFTHYAQAIDITQGRNKIFPCLYKNCILPDTLKFYFTLNFGRSGSLYNFWVKLQESIERAKIRENNYQRRGLLAPPVSPSQQFQPRMPEQERKRRLAEFKTKERATIQEINNTIEIFPHPHQQQSSTVVSAHIEEIVEQRPIAPPVTPPRYKSQNNLKIVQSKLKSKSQSNLCETLSVSSADSAQQTRDENTHQRSRFFKNFFKSTQSLIMPSSSSPAGSLEVSPQKIEKKKKRSLFGKKKDRAC